MTTAQYNCKIVNCLYNFPAKHRLSPTKSHPEWEHISPL